MEKRRGAGAVDEELRETVYRMYDEGYIQKYIGECCGISRQRVNTILSERNIEKPVKKEKTEARRFYWEALRRFMGERNLSARKFCILLGEQNQSSSAMARFLYGHTDTINIRSLNRILEVTGMTYEEIFMQDSEQVEQPMALEQLHCMKGEPVWIESWNIAQYDIYCGCSTNGIEQFHKIAFPNDDYGTSWVAYRKKPRGKEQNNEK